jgi:hypothetical protein
MEGASALLEQPDLSQQTPLHVACGTFDYKLLALLLEHPLDATRVTADGSTPLHLLAHRSPAKSALAARVITRLVYAGVDVNAINTDGDTALHLCALSGNDVVARSLLGAPETIPSKPNRVGDTPLAYAQRAGNKAIAKLLASAEAKQLVSAPSTPKISPRTDVVSATLGSSTASTGSAGSAGLSIGSIGHLLGKLSRRTGTDSERDDTDTESTSPHGESAHSRTLSVSTSSPAPQAARGVATTGTTAPSSGAASPVPPRSTPLAQHGTSTSSTPHTTPPVRRRPSSLELLNSDLAPPPLPPSPGAAATASAATRPMGAPTRARGGAQSLHGERSERPASGDSLTPTSVDDLELDSNVLTRASDAIALPDDESLTITPRRRKKRAAAGPR